MRNDNYFIKTGYEARGSTDTVETEFGDYWNETRIAHAGEFQWYVYRTALKLAGKHGLRTVLDLGCGYPAKLRTLFGEYDVTAIDQPTVVEALSGLFPQFRWYPANLEEPLPADSPRYDLVICADVIEHLLDPDPLLDRIRRSAREWVVLSTPERDHRRGADVMTSRKREHVREWNAAEFRRYLESSGFEVHRHGLYPQRPVPRAEFVLSRVLPVRTLRWSSCQVVVCRPA